MKKRVPNPDGRPPIEGKPRSKWVHIRVTEDMHRAMARAAGNQPVSDWIRQIVRDVLEHLD